MSIGGRPSHEHSGYRPAHDRERSRDRTDGRDNDYSRNDDRDCDMDRDRGDHHDRKRSRDDDHRQDRLESMILKQNEQLLLMTANIQKTQDLQAEQAKAQADSRAEYNDTISQLKQQFTTARQEQTNAETERAAAYNMQASQLQTNITSSIEAAMGTRAGSTQGASGTQSEGQPGTSTAPTHSSSIAPTPALESWNTTDGPQLVDPRNPPALMERDYARAGDPPKTGAERNPKDELIMRIRHTNLNISPACRKNVVEAR
jgi:hypothetical protein